MTTKVMFFVKVQVNRTWGHNDTIQNSCAMVEEERKTVKFSGDYKDYKHKIGPIFIMLNKAITYLQSVSGCAETDQRLSLIQPRQIIIIIFFDFLQNLM